MDCELDTHAHTCCVGSECEILHITGKADVTEFLETLGKVKEAPIVTAAMAYDDNDSGDTHILVFHQVLHFPSMTKHLLNPFQLHEAGVNIQDTCPQHLKIDGRSNNSHRITTYNKQLTIPLHLNGIFSSFTVRKPTKHELDIDLHFHIMTNDSPQWEPNDEWYALDDKGICSDINLNLIPMEAKRKVHEIHQEESYIHLAAPERYINFNSQMQFCTAIKHHRKGTVSPELKVTRWGIGIETAKHTFNTTTQLGVRDYTYSQGTRRLKHTVYQLKFQRLRGDMYTDTMFSDTKSLAPNTCAQIFTTDFNWVAFYQMKKKSDVPDALELLISDHGAFNNIIPDNTPELTSGNFKLLNCS